MRLLEEITVREEPAVYQMYPMCYSRVYKRHVLERASI